MSIEVGSLQLTFQNNGYIYLRVKLLYLIDNMQLFVASKCQCIFIIAFHIISSSINLLACPK
jgi:hypothetical protein